MFEVVKKKKEGKCLSKYSCILRIYSVSSLWNKSKAW